MKRSMLSRSSTLEVTRRFESLVKLKGGDLSVVSVPSGASTGRYGAIELRDENVARYGGKGVLTAISNVRALIQPLLKGFDASLQMTIDQSLIELDGTRDKSRLGANAILGVSMAVALAGRRRLGPSTLRISGKCPSRADSRYR